MSLSATSMYHLNISMDSDSAIPQHNLFQYLTIPLEKEFFLISNLSLLWCSLSPFPPILSLATWDNRPAPTWLQPPLIIIKIIIKSNMVPHELLFLQDKHPLYFSHSTQDLCSTSFTSIIAPHIFQYLNAFLVVRWQRRIPCSIKQTGGKFILWHSATNHTSLIHSYERKQSDFWKYFFPFYNLKVH